MVIWDNKELQRIEKMIIHGEFEKANKKIADFEKKSNLAKEATIGIKILKAKSQSSSSWTKSLELLEQVLEEMIK